jgi:hypothetical protein
MADVMANEGYLNAGYRYVNVDDCWSMHNRDNNRQLVSDTKRFPNGMKSLGEQVNNYL